MADYINPTNVNQSTEKFGSSDQFNVDPFMQPFPLEQQKTESTQYNQDFTNFLSGLETPEATRQRLENRYGYQDLQENYLRTGEAASSVMNAARATPENVQNRLNNSGTVTTQAQGANIVNKEVGELMKTYTQLGEINEQQGRRLAVVEQSMNQAAQLEMAQQQKMLTPWLQKYEDKNIMQAREMAGWSFASQLELNRLLANQSSGLSWSNAEAQRANSLALQEMQFKQSLEYLEKSNEFAVDLWG